MRRSLNFFSILAVAAAVVCFTIALYGGASPAPLDEIGVVPDAGPGPDRRREPFAGFPLDQGRRVDFELDLSFRQQLTEREMQDQVLDWLLYTAVADAGLSAAEVNEALFDLAPVRHGYLGPVASFEYGVTRARYVGHGRVVAVLPALPEEERIDLLAHLADEQRKNLGEMPGELIPFEYTLDPGLTAATVSRRSPVPAADLFTEESGYYQTRVASLDDLTRFLDRIDDVTYVRREEDHLVLGGRQLQSRRYQGVDVEDVAALWQSEQGIRRQELPGVTASGFSLDPAYRYDELVDFFEQDLEPALMTMSEDDDLPAEQLELFQEVLDIVKAGLRDGDHGPFFRFLEILHESDMQELVQFILSYVNSELRYQAARYDGHLQGTEVGMTLFYTDLLAKLWALDFQKSIPSRRIADFEPMTRAAVSPVFAKEVGEHSKTRLWFEPLDSGLQLAGEGDALLFARRATRIYAASATSLKPGEEGEPSAQSEAFIWWWNDHYEEIARYEPEYERLNEIMKWSAIVTWLSSGDQNDPLAFLGEVEVDHSRWFPTWVRDRADLRFRAWPRVEFYPRGYAGTETEAMALLSSEPYSRFGQERVLSGGHSLAGRQLFTEKRTPSLHSTRSTRRAGRTYDDSAPGLFETFEGRTFKLEPVRPGFARTVVTPRPAALQRNRFGEIARRSFEQSVVQTSAGLRFDARTGQDALGSLSITATANGFRTGWRGREVDQGFALARRLSRTENMDAALSKDPQVASYLPLKNGDYAVKMHHAERWLQLRTEAEPTVDLPSRWHARVSDPESGRRNLLLARIDRPPLEERLEPGDWIAFSAVAPARQSPLRLAPIRGPPESWHPVELLDGDARLAARIDPRTRAVAVRWGDLPPPARQAPEGLGRRLVVAAGSGNGGPLRVDGAGFGGDGGGDFARLFGNGDFRSAALAYAEKPERAQEAWRHALRQETEVSRRLADSGEIASALGQLDAALERYGPAPELTLQKALFQIDRGRMSEAVKTLEREPPTALTLDPFKEVPLWLRRGGAKSPRSGLRAVALTQARHVMARQGEGRGRLVPFFDGKGLDFSLYLADPPAGRVVSQGELGAVLRAEGLYLQDVLKLDPTAPVESSLQELVSTGRAFVIEMPLGEVGHYRPGKIFTPRYERSFEPPPSTPKRPEEAGGRPIFSSAPPPAPRPSFCLGFHVIALADDDEEDEAELRRRLGQKPEAAAVYLVAARVPEGLEAGDGAGCR